MDAKRKKHVTADPRAGAQLLGAFAAAGLEVVRAALSETQRALLLYLLWELPCSPTPAGGGWREEGVSL